MTESDSTGDTSKLSKAWHYFSDFVIDIVDLKKGVDPLRTIEDTRNGLSITGANAWMLMCSIIIASIGLSQNSQAVIIGAMLISPLMAPILGIGLSIGINDMNTLRQSLIHFAIAIFIAILTSSIYFYLSPIDAVTPEIEARTRPTFLDIFVAIFGGTAGIISIARKDISTTLPGVAIATALMPPLCVTGFGISHMLWDIAARSFYLFFLNSFFVVAATYIIIRYLKFPYKKYLDQKIWRKNVIYMSLFSLAIVIPSFLIFRGVIRDLKIRMSCDQFVDKCLGNDNIYLDSYIYEKDESILYLKVYGHIINNNRVEEYTACLDRVGLKDVQLEIISTSDVNLSRVLHIEENIQNIAAQLQASAENESQLIEDVTSMTANMIDSSLFISLKSELPILFPDLEEFGIAKMHTSDFDEVHLFEPVVLVRWKTTLSSDKIEKQLKLASFVAQRMSLKTIRLIEN